jgi:hypothetical protein
MPDARRVSFDGFEDVYAHLLTITLADRRSRPVLIPAKVIINANIGNLGRRETPKVLCESWLHGSDARGSILEKQVSGGYEWPPSQMRSVAFSFATPPIPPLSGA